MAFRTNAILFIYIIETNLVSYSTPFIIFFSNGQRQKRRTAAAPAMTAKRVKKSVRLVI